MQRGILLIVLIGTCLTALAGKKDFGTVTGYVHDDGNPIKKATVTLYKHNRPVQPVYGGVSVIAVSIGGIAVALAAPYTIGPSVYQVRTDKNGRFTHMGLPPGIYAMQVSEDGIALELVYGVKVEADEITTQNFDVTADEKLVRRVPDGVTVEAGKNAAQSFDSALKVEPATGDAILSDKEVLKVGGDVTEPILVYKAEPAIPEQARRDKIKGTVTVVMDIVVLKDGTPEIRNVVRPMGHGFDELAVEAIRKWKFIPAKKNGSPVNVYATVQVSFTLY